jgi:polyisoprenoid-binding protein YceI
MRQAQCWTAIAVLCPALMHAQSAVAESYIFNNKKSEVRFTYVMGLSMQHGKFRTVEGSLTYDERAPEKSEVFAKIATASVDTGQPIVDDELRGSNFFNAKASPSLTFRSTSVTPTAANAAQIMGDITVNGITKPVTLDVTVTPHEDPALKYSAGSKKFVAKTTISRSAFKMVSYADMVGDEIGIEIEAIVRPKR